MTISFEQVGAKRPVSRHLLRFGSAADFEAVLGKSERDGFIRFHSETERDLIGRVVRVSPSKRLIEVEAAVDTELAA